MALITCHECQQQISDKAPACPHCGVPAQPVPAAPATKPAGTTDYTLRIKQVIFAIFIGVVLVNYAIAHLPGGKYAQREARAKQAVIDSKESAATRAKEDAECRKSLNCWGEKHSVLAIMKCQDQIEHLAKYQAQWTDGILEAKFSRSQWLNVEQGVVRYSGDKIKFQNGFGAWMNQVYECDYNTEHDAALAVRAQPGRLP